MSKSEIIRAFNDHLGEFTEDVQCVFPTNLDIATAKNGIKEARKANPILLITLWYNFINVSYYNQVLTRNIQFFLFKNFDEDLQKIDDKAIAQKVADAITRLLEPVRGMAPENQEKCMDYIVNLSNLAQLANENGWI